ncbi:hypothetical protein GUJ93_ZPchr0088g33645 [Zizania palustris]|uniref:Uncharacterized protein n=1 Tax=Zizania palustris TaxID=103762 RepID=A0A8J5RCP8_ZIZPA|nr:hypothetical protein GUJ93_ZPchr0088g33645 [Zizania palustris]
MRDWAQVAAREMWRPVAVWVPARGRADVGAGLTAWRSQRVAQPAQPCLACGRCTTRACGLAASSACS